MNEMPKIKGVFELLKAAWAQYTANFSVLVPVMLISGLGLYLQSVIMHFYTPIITTTTRGNFTTTTTSLGSTGNSLAIIAGVIYLIGILWGMGAILNRINHMDQPMTVGGALSAGKAFIWPLFITILLVALTVIVGFILVIIPGIIFAIWYSLSTYIVVAEHKSGVAAMKASKEYVKGYWLAILGRALALGIVMAIVIGIISSIVNTVLFGNVIGMLAVDVITLAAIPFAILYQFGVYQSIKEIKTGVGSNPPVAPTPAPVAPPTTPATPAV